MNTEDRRRKHKKKKRKVSEDKKKEEIEEGKEEENEEKKDENEEKKEEEKLVDKNEIKEEPKKDNEKIDINEIKVDNKIEKEKINMNEIKNENQIEDKKIGEKNEEEIKIISKLNDMNEAPSLEPNKIFFNCSECSSAIQIISLDKNIIEFKCNNNHNIRMKIKDYLNKMKKYNDIQINNEICNIHKEAYFSYCFECKVHLCIECLKLGEHSYHRKTNIIEIMPNNYLLDKIREMIKQNKEKIKELNITKNNTENEIYLILNNNKNKIKDILEKKRKKNNEEETKELSANFDNYKLDIERLKKDYEKILQKDYNINNKNYETVFQTYHKFEYFAF